MNAKNRNVQNTRAPHVSRLWTLRQWILWFLLRALKFHCKRAQVAKKPLGNVTNACDMLFSPTWAWRCTLAADGYTRSNHSRFAFSFKHAYCTMLHLQMNENACTCMYVAYTWLWSIHTHTQARLLTHTHAHAHVHHTNRWNTHTVLVTHVLCTRSLKHALHGHTH